MKCRLLRSARHSLTIVATGSAADEQHSCATAARPISAPDRDQWPAAATSSGTSFAASTVPVPAEPGALEDGEGARLGHCRTQPAAAWLRPCPRPEFAEMASWTYWENPGSISS